jgi:hypothetical protein
MDKVQYPSNSEYKDHVEEELLVEKSEAKRPVGRPRTYVGGQH